MTAPTGDVVVPLISTDAPTRRLMLAFEQSGWWNGGVAGPYAFLRSPDRSHTITIRVSMEQPDKVVDVLLDAVRIDIAEATEFVKAHHA